MKRIALGNKPEIRWGETVLVWAVILGLLLAAELALMACWADGLCAVDDPLPADEPEPEVQRLVCASGACPPPAGCLAEQVLWGTDPGVCRGLDQCRAWLFDQLTDRWVSGVDCGSVAP